MADLHCRRLGLTLTMVLLIGSWFVPKAHAQTTYHVDRNHPEAADVAGGGSEAAPFVTVKFAHTVAVVNDTILVHEGRYCESALTLNKQRITIRGVGRVVLGNCTDVDDTQFQPSSTPNVYTFPNPGGAIVFQTHYPDVRVDDPNNISDFLLRASESPLALSAAPTLALVAIHEGTYRRENGILHVHPYGNVAPVDADFVLAGSSIELTSTAHHYTLQNLVFSYVKMPLRVMGDDNHLLDLRFEGGLLQVRGERNLVERFYATHVIYREPDGICPGSSGCLPGTHWVFDWRGDGNPLQIYGPDHVLRSSTLTKNWNSRITAEDSVRVLIDGLIANHSPNHCGAGHNGSGMTIRNQITWGCQDSFLFYKFGAGNVYEHLTAPGAHMLLRREAGIDPAPITVRNSIIGGNNFGVYGGDPKTDPPCTFEAGSLYEGNVFTGNARFWNCNTKQQYPLAEYIAKCGSGELTGCATLVNNVDATGLPITDVLSVGPWNPTMGEDWIPALVPGSPAIDAGVVPHAPTDIMLLARPIGDMPDAGAYEFNQVDCVVSEWGGWEPSTEWTGGTRTRTRDEHRVRSILTPPSGGGLACEALEETRTVSEVCRQLAVTWETDGFTTECSTWEPVP